MLTTVLAVVALSQAGQAAQAKPVYCPVMSGNAVTANNPALEYNGAVFRFCCPGCDTRFANKPNDYLKAAAENNRTIGVFLFDPVSGSAIEAGSTRFTLDHKGIRYTFRNQANLDAFKADPAKFTSVKKELLICPVMEEKIAKPSDAPGYVDYKGVRYYICCGGCFSELKNNIAKYAETWASKATDFKAINPK